MGLRTALGKLVTAPSALTLIVLRALCYSGLVVLVPPCLGYSRVKQKLIVGGANTKFVFAIQILSLKFYKSGKGIEKEKEDKERRRQRGRGLGIHTASFLYCP